MDKRHKDIMRTLVTRLRHILVGRGGDGGFVPGNLDRELERLGIAPDGTITAADSLSERLNGERRAHNIAVTQLERLPLTERRVLRKEIVERAAYTWINRLLALRAMEVRGLIRDTLRGGDEDYGGISEKLYFILTDQAQRATGDDGGWWAVIEDACNEQARSLPGLFALDDPTAALRPTPATLVQCIELTNGTQPLIPGVTLAELDETFKDPDAIGWAYQFYQEEAKAAIDAKCKSGGKAGTRAEIAAKTQLFTEPYMVQWLLQNSLGRSYMEAYPQSRLSSSWPYYVTPELNTTNVVESRPPFRLEELTLLDPCMGSGHFLREAFDMFVAMYREQHPHMTAQQIADTLLSKHLYGIDLDPRAAQLAQLTLYLRAWELVREEQRRQRKSHTGYVPPTLNLAMTPTGLDRGALARHLERNPHDEVLRPLLESIFQGLEQADTLGSLLRAREYLDSAIEKLQQPHTIQMDFDSEAAAFRSDVTELAKHDPARLKQILLDRVANSFHAEAMKKDDVSVELFAYEAERGVRLMQVLDRQYAVVVTNPPYLGSNYMSEELKKHVKKYFPSGKRDLYTAFILRCLEQCQHNGRVAMVTMHTWMFQLSAVEFRALPEEKLAIARKKGSFTGVLRETSIEAIAHLGPNAFEEITGEVVQSDMHVMKKLVPRPDHYITAFRLIRLRRPQEKSESLKLDTQSKKLVFRVAQNTLLRVSGSVISVYHLPQILLDLLREGETIGKIGYVSWGVSTCNNDKFLRLWWEVPIHTSRWLPHVKGGGYCKWEGLDFWAVDWRHSAIAIKTSILERFPYLGDNYEIKVRDYTLNTSGWTFSAMASKGLAVRKLYPYQIANASSPTIFLQEDQPYVGGFLNSIIYTFILRGLTTKVHVDEGYIALLPLKKNNYPLTTDLVNLAISLKKFIINRDMLERQHVHLSDVTCFHTLEALLHLIEGMINEQVIRIYNLSEQNIQQILDEIGTPAGWYPLIANYDTLPTLPDDLDLPALPQELFDYLAAHKRLNPSARELATIKANLKRLYEAGPKAKNVEQEESISEDAATEESEGEEEIASGAHIPIPTETFLEELSIKMQLHPISVYWLLEELRAEGVRCKPEEQRLLEDRLSVIVLRLLGHRWPKQIEAGEAVPEWAVDDGIIPLVAGTGAKTLEERVRARLSAEDGALETQKTEQLLEELTGQNLHQWLRGTFFTRHSAQFKHRPIAWHLASTQSNNGNGKKKRGGRPLFECTLYYHACAGDALARVRTQYVEPLLQSERGKINTGTLFAEDPASAIAQEHIRELEAFVDKLRAVEEHGFACPELQQILLNEPLDRWSGDGYRRPGEQGELLRGEEAWRVDINDGVRVNIAPLQQAGVLAKEVLNKKDANKAIVDRAHWRADERRWVRAGKLPRCGWMDEQVPESPAWQERAPIRAAEQEKLEQKRLALPGG
jgi:N-6 DNA Methylase